MILTCPACATSYFVPDEAIGPHGRRVRCKACGHDWRATPEDVPLELEPVADSPPAPETDAAPESLAETSAPELPRAFRARAERRRRARRAARQGLAWGLTAALALAGFAGAYLLREPIVQRAPRLAAVYEAVGIEVNRVGLEFEALQARSAPHDLSKVVVSGALRNVRDGEVTIPPVRIALLDARGAEAASRVIRLETAPVLPGGVQGFAAVFSDPERRAAGVGVQFAVEDRAAPVDPVPDASSPAEDAGLRRISAREAGGSGDPSLDSAPAQGVSPAHG